jgi:hypothetical protein
MGVGTEAVMVESAVGLGGAVKMMMVGSGAAAVGAGAWDRMLLSSRNAAIQIMMVKSKPIPNHFQGIGSRSGRSLLIPISLHF